MADLRAVPRLKLWLDEEQILDGDPLFATLQAAIHAADYVLHVVSARSVRSPWTNHEAMMALADQASRQQPRILVVRIDDVPMPFDPAHLAFVDLVRDYDAGFQSLLSAFLVQPGRLLARFAIDATYKRRTIIQVSDWVGQKLVGYFAKHPQELTTMNRRLFEELVAELFQGFGYEVELTQKTRDGGRDVIAVKHGEVQVKYLIECKRPDPGRAVGIQPVRELFGVKTDEGASKAILATTAHFSHDAALFFERHKWELEPRDYDGIMEWIKAYRK